MVNGNGAGDGAAITALAREDARLTYDRPTLGSPRQVSPFSLALNFTRDTNPDVIGFDVLSMMRSYGTIQSALVLIKTPVLSTVQRATVWSNDPKAKRLVEAAFLETGLLYRAIKTSSRSKEFGVAFHEIEWSVRDFDLVYVERQPDGSNQEVSAWKGAATVIKDLKEVNPSTVKEILHRKVVDRTRPDKPADGSYDGFIQFSSKPGDTYTDSDGNQQQGIHVPPLKSFVYTNDKEFGNMWGRARTRYAYQFYYWAQVLWKLWMAWAEKKIAPGRIAYFPPGHSRNGMDHADIAVASANALDVVTAIAFPSNQNEEPGKERWRIQEQETTDRSDSFQRPLEALNSQMLLSMFVPSRVFQEGRYGTKAEVEEQTDTFLLTLDADGMDYFAEVNRYLVDRFIAANFPPGVEARIEYPGLTDMQRALLKSVLMLLLADPEKRKEVDFRTIAEDGFQVPLNEVIEEEDLPEPPVPPVPPGAEEDEDEDEDEDLGPGAALADVDPPEGDDAPGFHPSAVDDRAAGLLDAAAGRVAHLLRGG